MHWYAGSSGPKLSFVCWPGSDPEQIQLEFNGQDSIKVDLLGYLKIYLDERWIELREAVAYQFDGGFDTYPLAWGAEYEEVNGEDVISFYFDTFDPALPLVLLIGMPPAPSWDPPDPKNLKWSSYMGGSESDEFLGVSLDEVGNAYVCGYTQSVNFPVNPGTQLFNAFNDLFGADEDMVVAKFIGANKQLAWATFHGGSGGLVNYEQATDIDVYTGTDPALEYVFTTGSTHCQNFPTVTEPFTPFDAAFEETCPLNKTRLTVTAFRKLDGFLHWSTTHGATASDFWGEVGTSIDVDDEGTLAVGGRLYAAAGSGTFPHVTPVGGFSKPWGGGMFILFDPDYQIKWCSPFGSTGEKTRVNDVKLERDDAVPPTKALYLTGSTSAPVPGSNFPLDVVQNGATFYQGSYGGGALDAYVARLDVESTYLIDYCTYWGGNDADMGLSLALNGNKAVYMAGSTLSTDLDHTQLADPVGSYSIITNAGGVDAYVVKLNPSANWALEWGTLFGDAGDDAFLDVIVGAYDRIYLAGESGSGSGINVALNPTFYAQDYHGPPGGPILECLLVSFNVLSYQPFWTTWFGGFRSDRAWGIAGNSDELFIAGGTWSDQNWFPLKEFDISDPLDYYDGDMLNNANSASVYPFYPWAEWYGGYHFGRTWTTPIIIDAYGGFRFDGFVASFGLSFSVDVHEDQTESVVSVYATTPGISWVVSLPFSTDWSFDVIDATGRIVRRFQVTDSDRSLIDLGPYPAGIYVLRCRADDPRTYAIKLIRQ